MTDQQGDCHKAL